MLSGTPHTLEHGSSRPGRWLQAHRIKFAAWIAAAEAIVVLFTQSLTKWAIVGLAVVAVLSWFGGRESRSQIVRQVLWIFAASQLLALIAVILGFFVKLALILAIVVFAIGGLAYLFFDRRS